MDHSDDDEPYLGPEDYRDYEDYQHHLEDYDDVDVDYEEELDHHPHDRSDRQDESDYNPYQQEDHYIDNDNDGFMDDQPLDQIYSGWPDPQDEQQHLQAVEKAQRLSRLQQMLEELGLYSSSTHYSDVEDHMGGGNSIFDFSSYKIDVDNIAFTQSSSLRNIYQLDQFLLDNTVLVSEHEGLFYGEPFDQNGLKSLVRIKEEQSTFNTMEILYFDSTVQYKMTIGLAQFTGVSFPQSGYIGLAFDGPARLFINMKGNNRAKCQQDLKYLKYQKRGASAYIMQKDLESDLGILKHGSKQWERAVNTIPFQQRDILVKSMLLRHQVLLIRPKQFDKRDSLLNIIYNTCPNISKQPKSISSYKTIKINSEKYLEQAYGLAKFNSKFSYYEKENPIKCHEVKFSLISLLYKCHLISVSDLFELADYLTKKRSVEEAWKLVMATNVESLVIELKNKVSLIDYFERKKIPKRIEKNENTIAVPTFKFTPSGLVPAGWNKDLRNRLLKHYNTQDYQFMKLEVTDDDEDLNKLFNCGEQMQLVLKQNLSEIRFMDWVYTPLTWTQSQLKTSSMWYTLKSSPVPFVPKQDLVAFLGDFTKIKNPALKMARIGQNMSTGHSIRIPDSYNISVVEDSCTKYKGKAYQYTDGIGTISPDIVRKIQKEIKSDQATAFQVRLHGGKGMLIINRNLPNNTIVMRDSMVKFECPNKHSRKYLDILGYNYFKPGYFNRQIMVLLDSNSIKKGPEHPFLQIQREFIRDLINKGHELEDVVDDNHGDFDLMDGFKERCFRARSNVFKLENISEIMGYMNQDQSLKILKEPTLRAILIDKMIASFEKLIRKSHFKVEKSARILGVIDDYGILQENEVYCTIFKPGNKFGKKDELLNVSGRVMVTRNPCMHPSDIRVVNCISYSEAKARFAEKGINKNHLEDLKNCVIFPQKGTPPLTAQISGSDLDGDNFFITWDKRLIPENSKTPYIVDEEKTTERKWVGATDEEKAIDFFSEFVFNNNLGRLANCHLAHADRSGPECDTCLQLCKAHNKAVDYPKKGFEFKFEDRFRVSKFPHFMQKGNDKKTYRSQNILGRIYDQAVTYFEEFRRKDREATYSIPMLARIYNIRYTDRQIEVAHRLLLDYDKKVNQLLALYKLERESQIYSIKVSFKNKEDRDRLDYLDKLRLRYFREFFRDLGHVVKDPIDYYRQLKDEGDRDKKKMHPLVHKKLLLLYYLGNKKWVKHDHPGEQEQAAKWKARIETRKGIQYNGFAWFCLPYLTFLMLNSK